MPDAPPSEKIDPSTVNQSALPAEQQVSARPRGINHVLAKLRALLIPITILLMAAGIIFLLTTRWSSWISDQSRQSTDDAYLRADVTPLSTKISGIVSRVAVEDYQRVTAGDLLVQIKDDDFAAQIEQAQAGVLAEEAALTNNHRQKELQINRIAQAQANVNATRADVERTKLERVREEELEKTRSSTHQKLEQAQADEKRFGATLISRQAELA